MIDLMKSEKESEMGAQVIFRLETLRDDLDWMGQTNRLEFVGNAISLNRGADDLVHVTFNSYLQGRDRRHFTPSHRSPIVLRYVCRGSDEEARQIGADFCSYLLGTLERLPEGLILASAMWNGVYYTYESEAVVLNGRK